MNLLIAEMVKRFYCDYCDASFPYSVEGRKKHGQGHFHKKLKKHHYDQFKTAKEKLENELQRERCRNFHSGRHCSYGDSCIYSHLTDTDMENLKQEALKEEEVIQQSKLPTFQKRGKEPTLDEWLSKAGVGKGQSHIQSGDIIEEFNIKYKLPACFQDHSNIPPSLIPPSIEDMLSCSFQDWG